mgnify:FL=1
MIAQWSGGDTVTIGKDRQTMNPTGKWNTVTKEQWDTLEILQSRHGLSDPVEVLPGLGYIGVMAGTMFIGIEPDGYSHT